jgi:Fe-S-cluster containining protein
MVDRLCPKCALCCNGVLFDDVRLRSGDDARRLAALGVPLQKRGSLQRFAQPCSCLEGSLCRIYSDRPERCRTFECRVLQRAMLGEINETGALKLIKKARQKAERVRHILRQLGDTDESEPLTRRYQRMMQQPIDLSAEQQLVDLRGELMQAVGELVGMLEGEFRS